MTAIAFTARTENWMELSEGYRATTKLALAHERSTMAASAANLAAARDTIKNSLDRINQLERDLQDVTQEIAGQRGEIAQLTADKRRADALAQRLTNELGIAQQARAAVEQQRQQFESRNIELERRNIDLNERVNGLTTQVTVINQNVRQQEQQIHILREENRKLAQAGGVPGSAAGAALSGPTGANRVQPVALPAAPKIAGHVLYVDGDLVTLSVGSADRVQKGAVFVIYRGKQYVGDLEITDVEPNLSSGRVIRSAPGVAPAKGDRADDEYHFNTPP